MEIIQKLKSVILLTPVMVGSLAAGTRCCPAAEPILSQDLSQAVKRLTASKDNVERSPDLLPRIRKTTWELLVGELAADSTLTLSSGSFDALNQGLKELDQILLELKENPKQERELTQQMQLAMRLDATRARRPTIEKQREISRQDELDRLRQLREINRTYRELIGDLMRWQTSLVIRQNDQTASLGEIAARRLKEVEQIVGSRRDYYLFDDEPALATAPVDELKLVRELAHPYANDVRRHQMAVQAYALLKLAMPTAESSRPKLTLAKQLAEAAVIDSDAPPEVGYWALALACRELGRLETMADPWDAANHERAQPLFELAKKNLAAAKRTLTQDSEWHSEIILQLAELTSYDTAIEEAHLRVKRGAPKEAIAILEHCASLHHSTLVAADLANARRLAGAELDELDQFVDHIVKSGLFSETDARFMRGRQGVLGIWRQFVKEPNPDRPADWMQTQLPRLLQALSDLDFAASKGNRLMRQMAEMHLALGTVMQLTIDPQANVETAQTQMLKVPLLIAELQQARQDDAAIDQPPLVEAIVAGRLAYGYLALRLMDDYRDVAPKAFANVADMLAEISSGLTMPRPAGSVISQTLLARPDQSAARLARAEQLVRQSLQRTISSMAALRLAPVAETAANLQSTARGLESYNDRDPGRAEMDPLETLNAKTTACKEVSNATILAFLAAREPAEALREAIFHFQKHTQIAELKALDLEPLREFLSRETDPARLTIVGLALEEYATCGALNSDTSVRELLALAHQLQQNAKRLFDDSTILQRMRPSEVELNQLALRRLTEPDSYLTQSHELTSEFRLSEARKLLDAGIRRHPNSMKLREAYVQTLIDEADLRPEHFPKLVASAIEQLEKLTANTNQSDFSSLLKLAELYERTANEERAVPLYHRIVNHTTDQRQRLVARSRLTTLQVRDLKQ